MLLGDERKVGACISQPAKPVYNHNREEGLKGFRGLGFKGLGFRV